MRLAGDMGIADHVTWTGIVRDPFGEGLFAAADVVCQVSRWEEVFGWVIAEAMAFSRPLVATRVGGIPELVQDGKSGFLTDRGDVEGMARRILELLGDDALRRRMGKSGRRIAEEKFDLRHNEWACCISMVPRPPVHDSLASPSLSLWAGTMAGAEVAALRLI